MDTRVAYWKDDGSGNLLLYNASDQFINSVPKAQASSYIAAYSSGNPAATSVKSSGGSTAVASSTSGGMTAAQSNAAAQAQASLAEQQRQFDLTQGERKARGDQATQLDQAKFEWDKAIQTGDRATAEKWKQVAADLAERQFKASISGPQDWVKMWRDSRATPGSAPSPSTNAQVPAWAGAQASQAAPQVAATSAVPKWTQAAPGWQQPNGQTVAPTVADLAAHGPTTANTFTGQNGTPIDFSGSDWMKAQAAKVPTWAR